MLSGFTIKNGFAENGGGIYVNYSGPSIINCIITNNTAVHGGGVFFSGGTITTLIIQSLTNCIISNNSADIDGGIYAPGSKGASKIITNCTIVDNSGSGVYAPYVWGSTKYSMITAV